MRLVLKVLWKSVVRILRRFGWGALLVPAAALSLGLFGIHLWTAAAVLVALILAVWRPATAASLVPVTMVAAGIAGLAVASAAPVGWAVRSLSVTFLNGTPASIKQWAAKIQAAPSAVPLKGTPPTVLVPPGFAVNPGQAPQVSWQALAGRLPGAGTGSSVSGQLLKLRTLAAGLQAKHIRGVPPRAFVAKGVVRQVGWAQPAGWWHGRLAVVVALILLTLGLWLVPRTMVGLVDRAATFAQRLRQHMRENRWGVLLVPVALFGLTVFGVRPWTLGMVVAAVVVAVKWPKVAADLVPVALAAFALYGFEIAAKWQSAPDGLFFGAPSFSNPVQYGAVLVDSRQTALLAGAEASVFLALGAWLVPRTIAAHLRTMFTGEPDTGLAGQVQRLTESRGQVISAATTELRRIERDLHDGAQARLVALGMNLRAVERMLPASPQAALALVAEARETSLRALNDLRSLVRGIYPPVLADRGLGHAVQALALDTPLPTELDISLPGRLPAPVESACYFAVAEALANAVRHSGARRVHIRMQHAKGMLRIEVSDDGAGGADPAGGTGLRGVEQRLGTFDGILAVSSPPGGPTMIVMEVPCALLSPKTSSC
jgi:signal transduction histidine kinase